MDYQTKIIIDASKAFRDLQRLEKAFHANDEVVSKFQKELVKLTREKKLLENQTKRLADAEMKSSNSLSIRIQRRKELATEYKRINALVKNEIANAKHSISMNKLNAETVNKLDLAYKKYGIQLNATGMFMKKLSGNTSLFMQKQSALNSQAAITNKLMKSNTIAISRYGMAANSAAASNVAFGNSVGFVNKFLKVQLVLFRTAMLAATAYMGVKLYIELNKTAESLDLLGRKLMTFTNDAKSLDLLTSSAIKTGFAIQDMGKIVTRFAVTTEGAFDTKTLIRWTEGLVISGRAVGTTTQEMNNALIQLSQSFSAGFLMGDEYRSISENLPLFKMALRDVADEAGYAGVSLKELSSGRKIDIDLMTTALEKLSKESQNYVFALDNIEAAEGRVKVGWELFLNSVAESDSLKESLNFIAGVFINLSDDQQAIQQFNESFVDLSESAREMADEFREIGEVLVFFGNIIKVSLIALKDFAYVLNDNRAILAGLIAGGIIFKVIKAIVALSVASTTAAASTGLLTKSVGLMIAFATPLGMIAGGAIALGAAFGGLAIALSSWVSESIDAREELKELNATIFESEEKMKSFIQTANDLNIDDVSLEVVNSTLDNMKNSASKLADELDILELKKRIVLERFKEGAVDTKALGDELRLLNEETNMVRMSIMRLGTTINVYSEKSIDMKEKLDKTTFSLKNFVTSIGIPEAPKSFTTYIEGIKQLGKETKAATEAGVDAAIIEENRAKGIDKLVSQLHKMQKEEEAKLSRKGRLTEAEKAENKILKQKIKIYNEGEKALKKYYKLKAELQKESIDSSGVSIGPDLSSDIEKYNQAVGQLGKSFALTSGDAEAYKKQMAELNELQKNIIKNKTTEYYEDLAKGYDDVKNATYEYNKVLEELNILTEKGIISDYARQKSLFAVERAMNLALAKAGEMSQQDQVFKGMKDGLDDFNLNTKTVFEEISELTTSSFNTMTDVLADFVTTGKLDFSSLVDSIIKDLARIAIQEAITKPLASGLSSIIGGMFGGSQTSMLTSQTGYTGGIDGITSGMEFSTWAKGGVFGRNGIQAFANGGIVNSPTVFPFANGTGLMGEAGPEAIMPLSRGSDGKLGVQASGGSKRNDEPKTIINVNNFGDNEVRTRESENGNGDKVLDIMIEKKVKRVMSSGGMDRTMKSTYGMNRRGN